MALEWLAPTIGGVTGGLGIFFTWFAGHQGRQHAERVVEQQTTTQIALAREARRAEAYSNALEMVVSMTGRVAARGPSEFPDFRDKAAPTVTKIALFGSAEVHDIMTRWTTHMEQFATSHDRAELKRADEEVTRLRLQMNSELTS
ncbi:hypothetical protein ABZ912_19915 [Nonomuraea angiospora]|uniref:hypothetical protein n=1 Tax=Nonomuraea angiospora TaxID=46172 RepID=UPI0033D76B8F